MEALSQESGNGPKTPFPAKSTLPWGAEVRFSSDAERHRWNIFDLAVQGGGGRIITPLISTNVEVGRLITQPIQKSAPGALETRTAYGIKNPQDGDVLVIEAGTRLLDALTARALILVYRDGVWQELPRGSNSATWIIGGRESSTYASLWIYNRQINEKTVFEMRLTVLRADGRDMLSGGLGFLEHYLEQVGYNGPFHSRVFPATRQNILNFIGNRILFQTLFDEGVLEFLRFIYGLKNSKQCMASAAFNLTNFLWSERGRRKSAEEAVLRRELEKTLGYVREEAGPNCGRLTPIAAENPKTGAATREEPRSEKYQLTVRGHPIGWPIGYRK